jgi:hypothetical protein
MQPTQGYATGSITTQNLNPNSGVPTPGSFVALPLTAIYDTIALQVFGTWGAQALSLQATVDGVNWITYAGAQSLTNLNTGAQTANIAAGTQGVFQADVASFQGVRLTQLTAGMTGTAVVSIAGTSANGVTGLDTPVALGAGSALIGQVTPSTTKSQISLNSAATTNATSTKASAGAIYEISASNMTAAIKYLKLYNKASAPTVGTDVPVLTIPIPANGFVAVPFGELGKVFATGIAFAITGAQAIADTTALAAGDVQLHGTYI